MVHKSAVFLTSLAALVVALVVAGGASAITATTINACVDISGSGKGDIRIVSTTPTLSWSGGAPDARARAPAFRR